MILKFRVPNRNVSAHGPSSVVSMISLFKEDDMRHALLIAILFALTAALAAQPAGAASAQFAPSRAPSNVDVSQRVGNESEEAIAVNPTNPNNIAIVTNIAEGVAGMFAAVSFDGGQTWAGRIIGDTNF